MNPEFVVVTPPSFRDYGDYPLENDRDALVPLVVRGRDVFRQDVGVQRDLYEKDTIPLVDTLGEFSESNIVQPHVAYTFNVVAATVMVVILLLIPYHVINIYGADTPTSAALSFGVGGLFIGLITLVFSVPDVMKIRAKLVAAYHDGKLGKPASGSFAHMGYTVPATRRNVHGDEAEEPTPVVDRATFELQRKYNSAATGIAFMLGVSIGTVISLFIAFFIYVLNSGTRTDVAVVIGVVTVVWTAIQFIRWYRRGRIVFKTGLSVRESSAEN